MLKRLVDILGALLLLIPAAPIIALIALAIKLDDPGPVFFRQQRIGRGGKKFWMLKFRKMPVVMPAQGPMLTRRHDPRLTRVGRWLERTKLDELPQLLNVLRGEMSLIGPRPEVERFVDLNDPRWQAVLQVPPGIFGLTQLRYRNESELYPIGCEDIETWYRERILPDKLALDMEYVSRAGAVSDIRLLLGGVAVSLFGAVTGKGLRRHLTPLLTLLSDLVLSALTFITACVFRLEEGVLTTRGMVSAVIVVVVFRGIVFLVSGTYRRRPSTLTYADLVRLARTVLFGSVVLLLLQSVVRAVTGFAMPRSAILMDALLLTILMLGKAYVFQQLLQMRWRTERRVPLPVSVSIVTVLTLLCTGALFLMMAPREDAPIIPLVSLLAAAFVIRGYLFLRHGLMRTSPGWSFLVYDVPGIVWAGAIGSLLIAGVENMQAAGLMAPAVLLGELGVALILTLFANRLSQAIGRDLHRPDAEMAGPDKKSYALMVGVGPDTEHWLAWIDHMPRHRRPAVAGLVCATHFPQSQTVNHVPVIGRVDELATLMDAKPISLVLFSRAALTPSQIAQVEAVCADRAVLLRELPRADDLFSTASGDALAVSTASASSTGIALPMEAARTAAAAAARMSAPSSGNVQAAAETGSGNGNGSRDCLDDPLPESSGSNATIHAVHGAGAGAAARPLA